MEQPLPQEHEKVLLNVHSSLLCDMLTRTGIAIANGVCEDARSGDMFFEFLSLNPKEGFTMAILRKHYDALEDKTEQPPWEPSAARIQKACLGHLIEKLFHSKVPANKILLIAKSTGVLKNDEVPNAENIDAGKNPDELHAESGFGFVGQVVADITIVRILLHALQDATSSETAAPLSSEWRKAYSTLATKKGKSRASQNLQALFGQTPGGGRLGLVKKAVDHVDKISAGFAKPEEEMARVKASTQALLQLCPASGLPTDDDDGYDLIAEWSNSGLPAIATFKKTLGSAACSPDVKKAQAHAKSMLEWMLPLYCKFGLGDKVVNRLQQFANGIPSDTDTEEADNDLLWAVNAAGIMTDLMHVGFGAPPAEFTFIKELLSMMTALQEAIELNENGATDLLEKFSTWRELLNHWPETPKEPKTIPENETGTLKSIIMKALNLISQFNFAVPFGRFIERTLETGTSDETFLHRAEQLHLVLPDGTNEAVKRCRCIRNMDTLSARLATPGGNEHKLIQLSEVMGDMHTSFKDIVMTASTADSNPFVMQVATLKESFNTMYINLTTECSLARAATFSEKYKVVLQAAEKWSFEACPYLTTANEDVKNDTLIHKFFEKLPDNIRMLQSVVKNLDFCDDKKRKVRT